MLGATADQERNRFRGLAPFNKRHLVISDLPLLYYLGTAQILGCRYYKRIVGQALNVLSSALMPLHKVDYYDEEEIARLQGTFA